MLTKTFTVPEGNVASLVAKLDALIKRAVKLGCAPPAYTVSTEVREVEFYEYDNYGDAGRFWVPCIEVVVSGEAPRYGGWTFIATRDHEEGGEPIIRRLSTVELPARFLAESHSCDHCHTRRWRKETFILQHEDGYFVQVGSTCIRDFLGHDSPESLAAAAACLAQIFGDDRGFDEDLAFGRGKWLPEVETYLAWVAREIRLWGWTSKANSGDPAFGGMMSTAMSAYLAMIERGQAAKNGVRGTPAMVPSDEDKARASAALAWARSISDADAASNEYLHNVRAAAKRNGLTKKIRGIVASIISAYDRAQALARTSAESKHVGEVGSRFKLVVKVATKKLPERREDTRLRVFVQRSSRLGSASYGRGAVEVDRYCNSLVDSQGNVFVWFTSTCLKTGATYLLSATVKAHSEYKGVKQTVLARCEAEEVFFEEEDRATVKIVAALEVGALKNATLRAQAEHALRTNTTCCLCAYELDVDGEYAEMLELATVRYVALSSGEVFEDPAMVGMWPSPLTDPHDMRREMAAAERTVSARRVAEVLIRNFAA